MEVGMKGVVVVVVVVVVGVVVCEREGGGMEVRIDGGREQCSVLGKLTKRPQRTNSEQWPRVLQNRLVNAMPVHPREHVDA